MESSSISQCTWTRQESENQWESEDPLSKRTSKLLKINTGRQNTIRAPSKLEFVLYQILATHSIRELILHAEVVFILIYKLLPSLKVHNSTSLYWNLLRFCLSLNICLSRVETKEVLDVKITHCYTDTDLMDH